MHTISIVLIAYLSLYTGAAKSQSTGSEKVKLLRCSLNEMRCPRGQFCQDLRSHNLLESTNGSNGVCMGQPCLDGYTPSPTPCNDGQMCVRWKWASGGQYLSTVLYTKEGRCLDAAMKCHYSFGSNCGCPRGWQCFETNGQPGYCAPNGFDWGPKDEGGLGIYRAEPRPQVQCPA
jgi:hypothetical protein